MTSIAAAIVRHWCARFIRAVRFHRSQEIWQTATIYKPVKTSVVSWALCFFFQTRRKKIQVQIYQNFSPLQISLDVVVVDVVVITVYGNFGIHQSLQRRSTQKLLASCTCTYFRGSNRKKAVKVYHRWSIGETSGDRKVSFVCKYWRISTFRLHQLGAQKGPFCGWREGSHSNRVLFYRYLVSNFCTFKFVWLGQSLEPSYLQKAHSPRKWDTADLVPWCPRSDKRTPSHPCSSLPNTDELSVPIQLAAKKKQKKRNEVYSENKAEKLLFKATIPLKSFVQNWNSLTKSKGFMKQCENKMQKKRNANSSQHFWTGKVSATPPTRHPVWW